MIKELEYIIRIAEEKSISKAAIKLCMSQSSLSQFLSLYEAELGTTLFTRSSSGTRLTYSGEIFLNYAKHAVMEYRQMQSQLWDVNNLKHGMIRMAVQSARGRHLMPPIIRAFNQKYPDIHVELIEQNSHDCIPLLLDGAIDMALMAVSRPLTNLPTEFIRKEEIYIAASENHPVLNYAKPFDQEPDHCYIEPEDASRFPFILTTPNTVLRTITEDLFAEHKLQIKCKYDNLTLDFALSMAEEGIGLLFCHESLITPANRLKCLSIGSQRLWRDMVLAYPTNHYRSKATKALADEIHAALDIHN